MPNKAPSTLIHWLKMLDQLARFSHGKEFEGREFVDNSPGLDSLISRLKRFISYRLLTASRQFINKDGRVVLRRPRFITVHQWSVELASLVIHLYQDALTGRSTPHSDGTLARSSILLIERTSLYRGSRGQSTEIADQSLCRTGQEVQLE
jgi:hypothetical protein